MILIISKPRSGSSLVARLVQSAGFKAEKDIWSIKGRKVKMNSSEFNKEGYNEDTQFTLFNDQIIRCLYGNDYSFLFAPSKSLLRKTNNIMTIPQTFYYDLEKSFIYYPKNYLKRLQEIAEHNWDVWGLSRMYRGGKWAKAYTKAKCECSRNLNKRLEELKLYFKKQGPNSKRYLKDPRLIFSIFGFLNEIKQSKVKILFVNRNKLGLLRSMRRHFGKRLFSKKSIDNTPFVSNHFNYKIKYQSYREYTESCNTAKKIIKRNVKNFCEIDYDKIISKRKSSKEIQKLEAFLEEKIDHNLIQITKP